jgi:hypothetical protein
MSKFPPKQDMVDFLKNVGKVHKDLIAFAVKSDSLLKSVFTDEREKWIHAQSCEIAIRNDAHEKACGNRGKNWIEKNNAGIAEFCLSNIGNKQAHNLRFTQKLVDNRMLDVVVTGTRVIPLKPDEIQKPVDLLKDLADQMVDVAGLKKTVDLVTLRKSSVSLLKKDAMPEDATGTLRFGMKYVIRDMTKAEEKVEAEKASK